MNYKDIVKEIDKEKLLKLVDRDRILGALGLETRHSAGSKALNALGLLGLGLLAGATIGLLLAPSAGSELRRDVARRLGLDADDAEEALDELIT